MSTKPKRHRLIEKIGYAQQRDDHSITCEVAFKGCSCGSDAFTLYRFAGDNHDHMQCLGCDTTYCDLGDKCTSGQNQKQKGLSE